MSRNHSMIDELFNEIDELRRDRDLKAARLNELTADYVASHQCNDLVRLACERACDIHGSRDMFNAANFSKSMTNLAGVDSVIDGRLVRAILCGRRDIEPLGDGCHFRLALLQENCG